MKKIIIFLSFLILTFASCNKYAIDKRPLTDAQKAEYLEKIKKDPLFKDYIESIASNYNKMATIIYNSDIDSVKFSKAGKAANYDEWLQKAKEAGMKNSEELLKIYKESPAKLKLVYQKYPLLRTQFTQQEQQVFISSNLQSTFKF